MKITKIQTWLVRPRWAFIEISTDAGISGWGEPVLEGRAATVCECIHEMEPYLIGADPMKIEDLWTVLFRGGFYRGGGILMSAISGIDQALWDIKGKYFNVPVWQLMGGSCRDKMRVYSWVGGDRPADVGRAALEKKKQGFTAIKMNGTDELQFLDSYAKVDALLERVASVRESCGRDFGIAIDFHGRVHKPMAKLVAKKLEEFDPMFIEEPVLCDNMEYFPEIAAACNIPIATGERLFTKYDFKRLLAVGGVDIVQPDLSHAGGLTECKKIAAMAEAHGCGPCSPLPAWPGGPCQLPESGCHLLQRGHSGAKHRHPLQRGPQRAGLCAEPRGFQVRERLCQPAPEARPWCRGEQGSGGGRGPNPAQLEEPGLEA